MTPLHEYIAHTYFSFLTGASSPAELIDAAIETGHHSLAITDMDGVYGIARAYRHLRKLRERAPNLAFSLRYGAEIHLQPDHHKPIIYQDTLVLLALTHVGYQNLCLILNEVHAAQKVGGFIPLEKLVAQPLTDVVAIQPMRGMIRSCSTPDDLIPRFSALHQYFKSGFYLAISRQLSPAEDCWISATRYLAGALRIPLLISQDVFFHTPTQKPVCDVLQAIRCNQPVSKLPQQLFINHMRCLHPAEQRERLYARLPEYDAALENARHLDAQFRFDLSELRYHYPQEFIPEGYSAQGYLEFLTWDYAKKRYPAGLPDAVKATIQHELNLIQHLDFADYFLTVYDIVEWARRQNILCQGRGSAANSAVCFVLGITAIDPAYFELLFERFISVERGDPPDIDVDFEHERREEVIQYIYERYGRNRAAMVCNVICFKAKGALRFSGRALGIPESALSRAAKILSSRAFRRCSASEAVSLVRETWDSSTAIPDHLWVLWGQMADAIRGFPRHLGIHSGGFLVSNQPLHHLCPVEPATMPGRSVIPWCKEDIEGMGFFKIDILALGGLTMIRKCFDLLRTHYNVDLTLEQLPANDAPTYKMIQAADTVGTFQIESRAQIAFLPRHRPQNFYDLVVQVAIIRPGPIQGGMVAPYLRRRNGEEAVNFPDPRLIPILKRTFGVPIFQEQVMRLAIAMGNFTPGEANELRKNIGAFSMRAEPDHWLDRLETNMRHNGVDPGFIDSILGHIQGFASYGFPESHAASFAILAYATAYLKCHYPTAFFAAILNAQPMGFYTPDTLIKTAQHLGVSFLPICIMNSEWDHQLEATTTPGTYSIRLGFRLVHGLSQARTVAMLSYRKTLAPSLPTPFEFLSRCQLYRSDITALAAANALACFTVSRRDALWIADAIPVSSWCESPEEAPGFYPETALEAVQLDYDATHTSLGPHPAALLKQHAWVYDLPVTRLSTAQAITQLRRNTATLTGFGMITCRQSPPTAKGMVFITVSDETGAMNLVIRPDRYLQFRQLLDDHSFICFTGLLQNREGAHSILLTHVHAPALNKADIRHLQSSVIPLPTAQQSFIAARSYF